LLAGSSIGKYLPVKHLESQCGSRTRQGELLMRFAFRVVRQQMVMYSEVAHRH